MPSKLSERLQLPHQGDVKLLRGLMQACTHLSNLITAQEMLHGNLCGWLSAESAGRC